MIAYQEPAKEVISENEVETFTRVEDDAINTKGKKIGYFVEVGDEAPLYSVRIKNYFKTLLKALLVLLILLPFTIGMGLEDDDLLVPAGIVDGVVFVGFILIDLLRNSGVKIMVFEDYFEILNNRTNVTFIPFESVTSLMASGKKRMRIQSLGMGRYVYSFNTKRDRNACYRVLAGQTLKHKRSVGVK